MVIIVKPSAELLCITENAEELIEGIGRVCYKSTNNGSDEETRSKFIQNLITNKHFSVLEHASATIKFVCDRGVSHELVRHRIASYTQESTRYCNYNAEKFGKEITVVLPFDLAEECIGLWQAMCLCAENCYMTLVTNGVPAQTARSVLPTCLKTEIVITANFREWLHIFELRRAPQAHPQMREIMDMAFHILNEKHPNIFR